MLTRETKTRSVPVGSTSESETIAGTCCNKRNPSILRRSSSPCGPGKLHDPTELIANSVGEGLDPVGRGAGLDLKKFIEIEPIVAKGEPGFGCRAKHERHHHCDKQRDEILQEQGTARTGHGRRIRW